MIRKSNAPTLKMAGKEMMRANSNFRIPLADLISRNTLPILNTLIILKSVGGIKTDSKMSLSSLPIPEEQNKETLSIMITIENLQ